MFFEALRHLLAPGNYFVSCGCSANYFCVDHVLCLSSDFSSLWLKKVSIWLKKVSLWFEKGLSMAEKVRHLIPLFLEFL